MDADCEQIYLAKQMGADRIELYTGPFAHAIDQPTSFNIYKKAAEHALTHNLGINAGHDLNLNNLELFSQLPGLLEVSIGHAITIDALQYGLEETIARYLQAITVKP
jgi:pyridoxine 5-phosphate synthase